MINKIDFIDLGSRPPIVNYKLNKAIKKNFIHNNFITGNDIFNLEIKLKSISKSKYALTCSNGTDALILALLALKIKKGDVVFVPSFTFVATAESVAFLGATPFFVDILYDSFNIDPKDLENGINLAKALNYKIKCIIVVDLFGHPCQFDELLALSKKHNIPIIVDAAQSFGSSYKKKNTGSMGLITTTSFFPTKPLGCFGDGGAIFTNDYKIYKYILSLRNHGAGKNKYENVNIGMNSRLNTIQASILLEKLKTLKKEISMRNSVANFYNKHLCYYAKIPIIPSYIKSSWAQYSLLLKNSQIRAKIINELRERSIMTNIYYPKPLHLQEAYKDYPRTKKILSVSEDVSKRIISLPNYSYINKIYLNKIVINLLECFNKYS